MINANLRMQGYRMYGQNLCNVLSKGGLHPPLDVLIRDDGAEREPANVVLHDNVIVHIEQRFYLLDLTLERPMT